MDDPATAARDSWVAPGDFVAYVDRRLPAVESATLRLTGDDVEADRLARELLCLVALRWARLRRADARHEQASGESADGYLRKLFEHEATELGSYHQVKLDFDAPGWRRRRSTLTGALRTADEAALIWERARATLRRRLLLALGLGGVALLAAVCRPDTPTEDRGSPVVESTALPSGVDLVPPAAALSALPRVTVPGLPAELAFADPQRLPALSAHPVRRAVALFAPSADLDSPVLALGDDGRWRRVDSAPARAGRWMEASALSPDGRRAAFWVPTGVMVVDLTTGGGRKHLTPQQPLAPIWLGPRHLLVGVDALLHVVTGRLGKAPLAPDDAVTPRQLDANQPDATQPPTRLLQLLSLGQPLTAPARLRRWVTDAGTPGSATVAVNGPRAELIGPWTGPAFGVGGDTGLVARVCSPRISLGDVTRVPTAAVVVVRPQSAQVDRVLLVDESASGPLRLQGWLDGRRVLLRCAHTSGQRLLAWNVASGQLALAGTIAAAGALALPDLSV